MSLCAYVLLFKHFRSKYDKLVTTLYLYLKSAQSSVSVSSKTQKSLAITSTAHQFTAIIAPCIETLTSSDFGLKSRCRRT
jgi:hypothetical protein